MTLAFPSLPINLPLLHFRRQQGYKEKEKPLSKNPPHPSIHPKLGSKPIPNQNQGSSPKILPALPCFLCAAPSSNSLNLPLMTNLHKLSVSVASPKPLAKQGFT